MLEAPAHCDLGDVLFRLCLLQRFSNPLEACHPQIADRRYASIILEVPKEGPSGNPGCGDNIAEADYRFQMMPLAPVLTSPWIGVEHGGAGRGLGDRVRDRLRAQLDTSFQMIRNARDRGISVMSGSDTGNASDFRHGRWHGKEAELFVREVGMPPMEAIVANISRNAWLMGLEGEVGMIAPGKLADIVIWNSGRVEVWRSGCRSNISVAASFVWRCLTGPTLAPSPHLPGHRRRSPAPGSHRTWRADFPHQRSSEVGSQHCERLQLRVWEAQFRWQ